MSSDESGSDDNFPDVCKDNPINHTMLYGTLEDLKKAIDDPDNVHYLNTPAYPPLDIAVHSENLDWVKLLLANYHVNLGLVDCSGAIAFHKACLIGNMDVIKLFINSLKKQHVKELLALRNIWEQTPLHSAAIGSNPEQVVPLLLHHGASAISRDCDNEYPSHYCENEQIKKMLVEREEAQLAEMLEKKKRQEVAKSLKANKKELKKKKRQEIAKSLKAYKEEVNPIINAWTKYEQKKARKKHG